MNFETLLYSVTDDVVLVTLNRPKVLNAMNQQMWMELQTALDTAKSDPRIKVVVVTGQGRAFSSGADLKESKTRSVEAYRSYLESLQEGCLI